MLVPKAGHRPGVHEDTSRLYLLSIGVGRYANPRYAVPTAATDARALVLGLGSDTQANPTVVSKLLVDGQATRAAILRGVKWLATTPTQRDVAMLYLRGRAVDDVVDTYHFLPYDADPENLRDTAITEEEVGAALSSTKGKAIVLLDTCHVGESPALGAKVDLGRIANKFSSPEFGTVVLAACDRRGTVAAGKASTFASAVVEGLSGGADQRHRGYITYSDLGVFVSGRIREMTSGLQSPLMTAPVGLPDFALVRLHAAKK
jgi:uncharacterized caspase-like protein